MTRNEYLIGLLMESADTLMESMGRNGESSKYYGHQAGKNLAEAKRWREKEDHPYLTKSNEKYAHNQIARGGAAASANREKLDRNQPGGINNPYGKMYGKKGTHSIRNELINQTINNNNFTNDYYKDTDEYGVLQNVRAKKQAELKKHALDYKSDMRYGQKNIFGRKKSPRISGSVRVNEAIDLLAEATNMLYGEY